MLPGVHTVGAVAPNAHDEPAGHVSHPACPASGWNRPAVQREQTALSARAKLPASHGSGKAEPVGHAEPASHLVQSLADARLVALP